jgi:His/Glu/Gln/Arg/opine family amino acid ABC transporter permease subunit
LVGFGETLKIFLVTLAFSLPLGLIIAFGSMSKFKPLSALTRAFVWVIRGTPLMLQLITVYYGPGLIFGRVLLTSVSAVYITFSINYACYFSEIYRGGIESIPVGQYEAAEVLGYTKTQTFMKIILPQVIKIIMPSVTNEVITLVKDTSLAFTLAYQEVFSLAKQISASQTSFMPFLIAGVFYFVANYVVERVMLRIERSMDYYK